MCPLRMHVANKDRTIVVAHVGQTSSDALMEAVQLKGYPRQRFLLRYGLVYT